MPPHDHLFKSLFRALFRDLLLLVDAQLAARLSPEAKVEFRDKELIPDTPEEEHRTVDLLAAVPDPAGGCAFLVHVEIERKAGKEIGQRLWDYSIRLRGQYPEPSVSLVVFLRGGPPGVAWQSYTEETVGHEVARFRYLSFGLSKLPAEQLLARPEPLAWGLAALAKPGALGRARVKFEAMKKIATAPIRENQRLQLINCVETYLPLKGRDAEEYASLLSAQETPEIRAMQLTWADKIEAKGIVKGRREGRKEGREEAADHLRRLVLRHLGQRFGSLPAALQKRLAEIRSVHELGAIADRVFEVRSIEELGLSR